MHTSGFWKTLHKWRARHISDRHFVLILSVLIGMLSGVAASVLKHSVAGVRYLLDLAHQQSQLDYLYLIAPLIGLLLTVAFVVYLNRNRLGQGIANILYNISRKAGMMETDKTYSHVATSALTVGFGGSVGLEAPIVTTGAALGSNVGRVFHMDFKRRLLLLGCGVSGALSAIFAAPIAGVIFVFEVLLLDVSAAYLVPLLLASVSGMITGILLDGHEVLAVYSGAYEFSLQEVPLYILLGVITGLFSIGFNKTYFAIDQIFARYKGRFPKAIAGGLILGILLFIFPPLFGEGYNIIRDLLNDNPQALLSNSFFGPLEDRIWLIPVFLGAVIVMKILATSVTVGAGGNGGVFAPSLFMGALLGFLFARVFNILEWPFPLVESMFALVAMAGLMSGIMHAPLTGIFLIAEVTSGYVLILPLMIVSSISYVTSIYFNPYSINTKRLADQGEFVSRDKDKLVLNLLSLKRVVETDLKTMRPDQTLGDLVEVIKHSGRNIFPVVDEDQKLQGIILLDDIRETMFKPELYEDVRVSELMHAPPAYVDLHDSMDIVMKKFTDTGAWNLPVLDGEQYVGFLSKSKIFSIYRTLLINQTREE